MHLDFMRKLVFDSLLMVFGTKKLEINKVKCRVTPLEASDLYRGKNHNPSAKNNFKFLPAIYSARTTFLNEKNHQKKIKKIFS